MAPRARRTALIVASVPELTNRTISTDGKVAVTRSANLTSSSVGAPNVVPRAAASPMAASTAGCACLGLAQPQEGTRST